MGADIKVLYRFRARATKKMTVELAEEGEGQGAFVWPEEPEDYSPYVISPTLFFTPSPRHTPIPPPPPPPLPPPSLPPPQLHLPLPPYTNTPHIAGAKPPSPKPPKARTRAARTT